MLVGYSNITVVSRSAGVSGEVLELLFMATADYSYLQGWGVLELLLMATVDHPYLSHARTIWSLGGIMMGGIWPAPSVSASPAREDKQHASENDGSTSTKGETAMCHRTKLHATFLISIETRDKKSGEENEYNTKRYIKYEE